MVTTDSIAPPLLVSEWLNAPTPPTLEQLRGRVVALHVFQMLCPGCVSHGLPQAQRMQATFDPDDVVVLGLHSVFEHHEVMGPDALRVFLSEYRITFPVAVDQPVPGTAIPATMQRYSLQGTPSIILIDRHGRLRHALFGRLSDLEAGALLASLAAEPGPRAHVPQPRVESPPSPAGACSSNGCSITEGGRA